LIDPDEMSLSYRAELLHRANQKARSYGDKIKQVLAVLMDKTRDIMVVNSLGEWAEDLQKRVVFFVEVVASDGSTLQRGYESVGGTKGFEIFEETPPELVAEKSCQEGPFDALCKTCPCGAIYRGAFGRGGRNHDPRGGWTWLGGRPGAKGAICL
jgi:TldD protein